MQNLPPLLLALLSAVTGVFPFHELRLDIPLNLSNNVLPSAPAQPQSWHFRETLVGAVSEARQVSVKSRLVYVKGHYDAQGRIPDPSIDVYFDHAPDKGFYLSTMATDYGKWSGPQDVSPSMPIPGYVKHFFAPVALHNLGLYGAWQRVRRAGWPFPLQDFEVFYDSWPLHQVYYRFQADYLPQQYVRIGCNNNQTTFEKRPTEECLVKGAGNKILSAM